MYLIQAGIVAALGGWWWALAYLLVTPLTGLGAMRWQRSWRKWRSRLRYRKLQQQGDARLSELIGLRQTLRAALRRAEMEALDTETAS
ncbi:MAG: hypothetical protein D6722_25960 [Bacteroidetes bacterium]|nr:MAG: hypothetical protein D6722_25960 [Bacteroidota bacterium]